MLCCWPGELARCVPFYLHLDEGTGLRKSAVLIFTAQAVFGQETASRFEAEYASRPTVFEAMTRAQFHSSKGSTYKSRFLFTCLPKKWYSKKNSHIYPGMLQTLTDECLNLFTDGIQIAGQRYFFICLGLKADQPAQAKAGRFNRSFANMGRNKGCCFECLAGLDPFPFEEISRNPRWLPSMDTVLPWDPTAPSPLVSIPHRQFQSATFFKRDPFHLWKQSIGGHYVASSIVLWWTWDSSMCLVWPTRWKSSSKGHPLTLPFGPGMNGEVLFDQTWKPLRGNCFISAKHQRIPSWDVRAATWCFSQGGWDISWRMAWFLKETFFVLDEVWLFSARVTSCHCCKPLVQHRLVHCIFSISSIPLGCGWNQMFHLAWRSPVWNSAKPTSLWPRVAISFDFADSTLNLRCMVFRTLLWPSGPHMWRSQPGLPLMWSGWGFCGEGGKISEICTCCDHNGPGYWPNFDQMSFWARRAYLVKSLLA